MTSYEAVIGLETHIQLNTKSKIFCSCKADSWGDPPNTNICPICTGQPGVLPAPNKAAFEKGVLLAAAMNADIQPISFFDRKNYFYPDLPKGYQISQYDQALAEGGYMDIPLEDGSIRRVRIQKLHIEEDAGKTVRKAGRRLLDFNRCGVPLVEMVTLPDLHSADEAALFITRLRQLLRWIGVSHADMEKGHLRIDANVSIREAGTEALNPKTEIKNVNSIEHIRDAINAEVQRQIKEMEEEHVIRSWTLDWNEDTQTLSKMRSKETEADYRYFREPDLLPIHLDEERKEEILASLPELPLEHKRRFQDQYDLPDYDADILTSERALSDYFESTVKSYAGDAKRASNWIINDLLGLLNERDLTPDELYLNPPYLADVLSLIDEGTINTSTGKMLLEKVEDQRKAPQAIVKEEGLAQVTDSAAIESVCQKVISENPSQVEQYREGKGAILGWFIGQVMAKTGGKADPQAVRNTLQQLLQE
jgi:aspartyl-tRNA(Asn)/glutamyl-tRNA(Gln) amidotransferase subunit B